MSLTSHFAVARLLLDITHLPSLSPIISLKFSLTLSFSPSLSSITVITGFSIPPNYLSPPLNYPSTISTHLDYISHQLSLYRVVHVMLIERSDWLTPSHVIVIQRSDWLDVHVGERGPLGVDGGLLIIQY